MTCEPESKPSLKTDLIVNGQEVELNCFVQEFMGQAIIGMLTSLRGVSDVKTVNLNISKPSE